MKVFVRAIISNKSWRQPPNLERIICCLKFYSEPKVFQVKKCNKLWFYREKILEGSEFKFGKETKPFFLKLTSTARA